MSQGTTIKGKTTAGQNVEVQVDSEGRLISIPVEENLTSRIDDTSVADMIYIGKAVIGSAESAEVWQVSRLDVSNGLVRLWANGDALFNNAWDDRVSLPYS